VNPSARHTLHIGFSNVQKKEEWRKMKKAEMRPWKKNPKSTNELK
jgi:hypothetical protein